MTPSADDASDGRRSAGYLFEAAVKQLQQIRAGRGILRRIVRTVMTYEREIDHHGLRLRFATPNALTEWRADTFAAKEPETLAWIDQIPRGATLWDVGANVGQYSIYAARVRACRVFAFEPSVFNLELLARNVRLNDMVDQVCLVPLALSDACAASRLRLTTTEWGGAMSTFGHHYGWDGRPLHSVFEVRMLGVSMDDAVEKLGLPAPEFIKIDVDGIEHVILAGGAAVLSRVRAVLIEVNDDFGEHAEQCEALLSRAGLRRRSKEHSVLVERSAGYERTFNQIWERT